MRSGSHLAVGVLLVLTSGCPRPAFPGSPDGGALARVLVEAVEVASPRVGLTGPDGGWVSFLDTPGTVSAYAGETLRITGEGWDDPLATRVEVEGTALQVTGGLTGREVLVAVPEDLPSGTLRVTVRGVTATSPVTVRYLGAGHLRLQRSRGVVRPQVSLQAGSYLAPAESGDGTTAVTPREPVQAAAFNLGLSPDPRDPQYLASISRAGHTTLTPAPDCGSREDGVDCLMVSTTPYLDRETLEVRVAGLQRIFGVDGGMDTFRAALGPGRETDPEPGLRGPIHRRVVSTSLGPWIGFQAWRVGMEGDTPWVGVALLGNRADGGVLDRLEHDARLSGVVPVAAGTVQVDEAPEELRLAAPSLAVAHCRGRGLLEVTLFSLGGDSTGVRRDLVPDVASRSCDLCDRWPTNARALFAMVPPVLRELVVVNRRTWVLLPPRDRSSLEAGEAPCVLDFGREPATPTQESPPFLQTPLEVKATSAAVVSETGTSLLALSSSASPLGASRVVERVTPLELVRDGRATTQRLPTQELFAEVFGDPRQSLAYALRESGDVLDVVNADGLGVDALSVLGTPLAAWPVPGGKVATARRHSLMVMDLSGFPSPFLPTEPFPLGRAALERDRQGRVVAVWGGLHHAAGGQPHAALQRWAVSPTGAVTVPEGPEPGFSWEKDGAGTGEVAPLFVSDTWVVVETSAGVPGHGCNGVTGLAVARRSDGRLDPLDGVCGATALDFNPWLGLLYLTAPVAQGDRMLGLKVVDVATGDSLDPPAGGVAKRPPFANLVALPGGSALGVSVEPGYQTRWMACVTRQHEFVSLGPNPFNEGPLLLAPDGTRLYAGSGRQVLEIPLEALDQRGCPPVVDPSNRTPSLSVTSRIPVEGIPTRLEADPTGERLVWLDEQAQVVGVVE
jgi:hypothetical protein